MVIIDNTNAPQAQKASKPIIRLSQKSLCEIASNGLDVAIPAYDRRRVQAGIVHFGVSNFFRSHQAVYIDDLMNLAKEREDHSLLEWGVVGVSVTASGAAKGKRLRTQDFLTTVMEQDGKSSSARVVGSLVDFLAAGEDPEAVIQRLADPNIRLVTLTVTKGCYFVDLATGRFNGEHPAIKADAANPDQPKSVFGLIVAGLHRRREQGLAPFAVLSCDNILHNGTVARSAVVGMAQLIDKELADWINSEVAFPNAMVDRITPATGDVQRQLCTTLFGIEDDSPVFCEPFRQWVVEDKFPAGRPPLELVGVRFVPDVTPYENMKIRILNGGHVLLAHLGVLVGVNCVHDFMAHPLCRAFWRRVEMEEIVPLVEAPAGTNATEFWRTVERRLANPSVADPVKRLASMGCTRMPAFLGATLHDRLKRDLPHDGIAMAHALWARYCAEESNDGDAQWERLHTIALLAKEEPTEWLRSLTEVYGAEGETGSIGTESAFHESFVRALSNIWENGVQKAVLDFVRSPKEPMLVTRSGSLKKARRRASPMPTLLSFSKVSENTASAELIEKNVDDEGPKKASDSRRGSVEEPLAKRLFFALMRRRGSNDENKPTLAGGY